MAIGTERGAALPFGIYLRAEIFIIQEFTLLRTSSVPFLFRFHLGARAPADLWNYTIHWDGIVLSAVVLWTGDHPPLPIQLVTGLFSVHYNNSLLVVLLAGALRKSWKKKHMRRTTRGYIIAYFANCGISLDWERSEVNSSPAEESVC